MYNSKNLPLSSLKVVKKSFPGILFLIVILISWYGLVYFNDSLANNSDGETILLSNFSLIVSLFIYLAIIATIVYQYLYYKFYYYNFEDKSAEIKKGVVSLATGHVNYERLQNLYIDQDVSDRILGLYDVHYETAGEASNFYSHVDGLNKENSDKLIAFIKEKLGQKSDEPSIKAPTISADKSNEVVIKQEVNQSQEISRKDITISKALIYTKTLATTTTITLVLPALLIGFFTSFTSTETFFLKFGLIVWIFFGLVIFTFFTSLIMYNIWYNNFYFIFDKEKIELREAIISRASTFVYYDRIQNVNISQGIVGRLFNFSRVDVENAASNGTTNKNVPSKNKITIDGLSQSDADKILSFTLEKARQYRKL